MVQECDLRAVPLILRRMTSTPHCHGLDASGARKRLRYKIVMAIFTVRIGCTELRLMYLREEENRAALFLFSWKLLLLTVPLSLVPFHALRAEESLRNLRHAFRKFAALRAHFRAALRRWQNCLVSNGAECFQLFLGGESLGCEGLLDSGHCCFGRFTLQF